MRRLIKGFCIATLCIGSLAACNNGTTQAGQVGQAGPSASPSGSSPSPTSPAPTSPAPRPTVTHGPITLPSTYPSGDITISGTVQAGAEPSCLTVTDSGRQYLLLSTKPSPAQDGDVVKVTGHVISGIMTHCMQGIPFEVTHLNVLSSHS